MITLLIYDNVILIHVAKSYLDQFPPKYLNVYKIISAINF